jgi:D-sedoheptulose 7-phosphate isomerase
MGQSLSHSARYLAEVAQIAARLDPAQVEALVARLIEVRERGGRVFFLGVGGSAANCSHAVNDFRKLAGIEAYSPSDNVAELTARTNDEGWETVFEAWLRTSRADRRDAIFVLSVGGGDVERGVSVNLVRAVEEARRRGVMVLGIVGREGSFTDRMGDEVVVVPLVEPSRMTPHAEAFQAVLWHCLVSHPRLAVGTTRWEALTGPVEGGRQ